MAKVLLVIGDGAEVIDTMVPYYRLGEDYEVVVAAPEERVYHLVQHEHDPTWDITVEMPGYTFRSDVAFRDVNPDDYIAMVLPGGRAPEFLRYDADLIRITKDFFAKDKPVASICHGIEILATGLCRRRPTGCWACAGRLMNATARAKTQPTQQNGLPGHMITSPPARAAQLLPGPPSPYK